MTPDHLTAAAWLWFCLGILSGAGLGLIFHKDRGWGGYASWPRRLARLGHISFFGTGALLLAMALTPWPAAWVATVCAPAMLLGALTMPLACGLAAWKKPFRHLFPVPVLGLAVGVLGFTWAQVAAALSL